MEDGYRGWILLMMICIPLIILCVIFIQAVKTCDSQDKAETYREAVEKGNSKLKQIINGECDLLRFELFLR